MAHPQTTDRDAPSAGGDKSRRILEAGLEVFAERGYFHATIAEVARRAGVADGTIYLYYRGKEDLLIRVFEEIMREINERLDSVAAEVRGAGPRLLAVARAQAELVVARPAYAEIVCVEMRQSSRFMKEYDNAGFRTYLGRLTQIIEEGRTRGELDADLDAASAARAFFGALDELNLAWCLSRHKPFDLRAAAGRTARIFVRGLGGEPV